MESGSHSAKENLCIEDKVFIAADLHGDSNWESHFRFSNKQPSCAGMTGTVLEFDTDGTVLVELALNIGRVPLWFDLKSLTKAVQ